MKKSNILKSILISTMVFLYFPNTLWAQESVSKNSQNQAAQYFLGARDEVLIKVNVLGYIQRPGQYLVPRHTDLISLISFAGGERKGANLSKVRILRKAGLEKGKNGQNGRDNKDKIITVDVKRYFDSGESSQIPTVKAGDTVLIPQSSGDKFRSIMGIGSVIGVITATATIALVIDRIYR